MDTEKKRDAIICIEMNLMEFGKNVWIQWVKFTEILKHDEKFRGSKAPHFYMKKM